MCIRDRSLRYGAGVRLETDAALGPFAFRMHDDLTGEELTRPPAPGAESLPAGAPALPSDAEA